MSGICDKCKYKPCPAEGEGLRSCDFYTRVESNYAKLFGTPERAAQTLANLFANCNNGFCFAPEPEDASYDAMLEFMRGEGDGE